jgi:hypothetical protein
VPLIIRSGVSCFGFSDGFTAFIRRGIGFMYVRVREAVAGVVDAVPQVVSSDEVVKTLVDMKRK